MLNRTLSIAPMMDYTDRHCRYFMRLLAPHALVYTEMVVSQAIVHGDLERLLSFDSMEHPIALQLGGSDPQQLAIAARIGEDYGYDEINLNIGCPSSRVQRGRFGACLMKEPNLVADCVAAMCASVNIPVTVKTRIGVDQEDSYDFLKTFVERVTQNTGCHVLIIHARKAWLSGLSPKENREIPPLCYERVIQLKQDFPSIAFVLNGGLKTLTDIQTWLPHCDGVMIGRAAYHNPCLLVACEQALFDPQYQVNYEDMLTIYGQYAQAMHQKGISKSILLKPLLGLFSGLPGAKRWRQSLTNDIKSLYNPAEIIKRAVDALMV